MLCMLEVRVLGGGRDDRNRQPKESSTVETTNRPPEPSRAESWHGNPDLGLAPSWVLRQAATPAIGHRQDGRFRGGALLHVGSQELYDHELPSNCPQNASRDGKKSWRNSTSTRRLKSLSFPELSRKYKLLHNLQKRARLNPTLSVQQMPAVKRWALARLMDYFCERVGFAPT